MEYWPIHIAKRPSGHLSLILIYALIGLIGVLLIYFMPGIESLIPPCMFFKITGLPCLSCGMTRSAFAFSHLDFSSALKFNPLFALSIFGLSILAMIDLTLFFTGRRYIRWNLTVEHWKIIRWIIIAVIGLNWLYLILYLK